MHKRLFFWIFFCLSGLGLLLSLRLIMLDYTVLTGTGVAECNLNATFDCSAVARSSYAFLIGIPVAAWGLLGYALVLAYLLFNRAKDLRLPLLLIYGLFSGVSLYYFWITKQELQLICLYCLFTYLINWGATAGLLFLTLRPPAARLFENLGLLPLPVLSYSLLSLGILLPAYLVFHPLAPAQRTAPQALLTYPPGHFEPQNWLASVGAEAAQAGVVVEVFSDYQCPYCAQFEPILQQALQEFANLRLIRKEFPLDRQCNRLLGERQMHPFACQAAYFAKCAGLQGQFWQAAEALHLGHEGLSSETWGRLSRELKLQPAQIQSCMAGQAVQTSVLNEIQEGLFRGIDSTPAYFINGKKQAGILPYPEFKALLLQAGGQLKRP
jgi:protein-disulfide isomerase/uncharacterized membrane protein